MTAMTREGHGHGEDMGKPTPTWKRGGWVSAVEHNEWNGYDEDDVKVIMMRMVAMVMMENKDEVWRMTVKQ